MDLELDLKDLETAAEIPRINGLVRLLEKEGAKADLVLSDTESPYLSIETDGESFRLVYSLDGGPEEELFRLHFILRAEEVAAPDLLMETRCTSFNSGAHLSRAIYRPAEGEVILYYQLPEISYFAPEVYGYVMVCMLREAEEWRSYGR